MKRHKPMPSIALVRGSYRRQVEMLEGLRLELDRLLEDFTEGHDAGLAALKSGTGKLGSRSSGSNTTTEAGYEFHRLQGACAFAAGLVFAAEKDLKSVDRRYERAGSALFDAWLDTDPDLGPARRERRAAATDVLTVNHTSVILPAVATGDGAG